MSKGKWRPKPSSKITPAAKEPINASAAAAAPVSGVKAGPPTFEPLKTDTPQSTRPPLPPINHHAPTADAPRPVGPVLDEVKMKEGLSKTFCSVVASAPRLIKKALPNSHLEFEEVTPAEGDLWATFAFPVLKSYLPNVEQHPLSVLATVTIGILIGKIKFEKTEDAHHAGSEAQS